MHPKLRNCKVCGVELDISNSVYFGFRKKNRCRVCYNKYELERYHENPKRQRYNRSQGLKKYGISTEEYENLLKIQDGKCAICSKEDWRKLSVDHNHETGKIRGLLCMNCNAAIGVIERNIDKVREYLRKYEV
jgi:hypothetical protein